MSGNVGALPPGGAQALDRVTDPGPAGADEVGDPQAGERAFRDRRDTLEQRAIVSSAPGRMAAVTTQPAMAAPSHPGALRPVRQAVGALDVHRIEQTHDGVLTMAEVDAAIVSLERRIEALQDEQASFGESGREALQWCIDVKRDRLAAYRRLRDTMEGTGQQAYHYMAPAFYERFVDVTLDLLPTFITADAQADGDGLPTLAEVRSYADALIAEDEALSTMIRENAAAEERPLSRMESDFLAESERVSARLRAAVAIMTELDAGSP